VRLWAPAGQLDSPLPFKYDAELKPAGLEQLTEPLLQLFTRQVLERLQELVKLYERLATAASAQGLTVIESTGEAMIEQGMLSEALVEPDLVTAYRRAYNNFEGAKNRTRGFDLLATFLVNNASNSVQNDNNKTTQRLHPSVLKWCSASISGQVAAAVDSASAVQLSVLFMGHHISFDTPFDWVDPLKTAQLMFDVLWERALEQMQAEDAEKEWTGALSWNATFGTDTCRPQELDGIVALNMTPLDFELPTEQAVAKQVGPLGSVEYLSSTAKTSDRA
jgi:hypothetical protein